MYIKNQKTNWELVFGFHNLANLGLETTVKVKLEQISVSEIDVLITDRSSTRL